MPGKTDWLEAQILSLVFRRGTFTPPQTLWVALCTTDPGDGATGATIAASEIAATGGYARAPVTTSGGFNAPVASGEEQYVANTNPITFPQPTGTAWNGGNLIGWFALVDTPSGSGNVYYTGALTQAKTIGGNDGPPTFPAGALVVREG